MRADKNELRAQLRAGRAARTTAGIAAARRAVRVSVLERCSTAGWHIVAAYEALPTEPGSPELLASLTRSGLQVLVPITLSDRDLDWRLWAASGPTGPPLGRDAIGTADLIIVPALAVSRDGTRLGQGGGSYDRALARARVVPTVALVYDDELLDELPRDPWDQPVSAAAHPGGWTELG